MKKFLKDIDQKQNNFVVYFDSQNSIHLSNNSSFHCRTKHIDVRYYWIRDVLEMKLLHIRKIHTNNNGSDMMTKALAREKLAMCRKIAGMSEAYPT